MDEGRPSRTAVNSARMRALHLLVDDDPKIFRDPLAALFCDTEDARRLRRLWDAIFTPRLAGLRTVFVLRHRFAEDSLEAAYRRGVRQYVVLGAGLDTFAYRVPAHLGALHVYEVDHPATQNWKRRHLEALGIAIPPCVTYVPVDFERQSLGDALRASHLRTHEPAYLSWLGVTPYLTPEAVHQTLAHVARTCAVNSEIAFDFALHPAGLNDAHRADLEAITHLAAEQGEPWLSLLHPATLQAELRALGFAQVAYLSAEEANTRYTAGRTDGLRLPDYYGLITARVGA